MTRKHNISRAEYLCNTRAYAKRGFDLGHTKVPPLAVIAIREAARKREAMRQEISEKYSNEVLAKQWGVSVRAVQKILSYETARHVV